MGKYKMMGLTQAMEAWISENNLFGPGDKVLLAVSGGVDSMVMLSAMKETGRKICVAHCNFSLRGAESDGDEAFVREFCNHHAIPLHVKKFQTRDYAAEQGLNIQLAARELRYRWFEELRQNELCSCIAVAHNQDDALETFFINLFRGAGIKGLSGIPIINGYVVRPLLFASRSDILSFARERGIGWREDSSNASDYYLRNRIRHQLLPLLNTLKVPALSGILRTMENNRSSDLLQDAFLDEWIERHCMIKGDEIRIPFQNLEGSPVLESLLSALVRKYGFNTAITRSILQAIHGQPGKIFLSGSHRLLVDRVELCLTPNQSQSKREYEIDLDTFYITEPVECTCEIRDVQPGFVPPAGAEVACLDYEKLQFPLKIRAWSPGDRFRPIGMKGFKKLSDFFIDQKLSRNAKDEAWVLLSGDEIVWVVGMRIDDRYKMTKSTHKIFFLTLL